MKVGIDLGTTYSAVARYDRNSNKPVMIPNAFGKEITPSVICFLDDGDILVGEDAKDMQSNGTGVNAAAFKRNMGDGSIAVSFNGKDYTSEDLSAMLLKHLIADAEKATGEKIDEAVITVPAYFNDFQRTATIRAGESCGVKVPKIINEPTAAAISYGYKHSSDKTVMVYDLGGGTFDVTIVRISKGNIEVVGTEGNHILGGKDWDAAIVKYVCDQFIDEFDVDPRDDLPTKNELIVAAEGYKKTLSIAESVTIPLNYDGYSAKYTLTRDEFESMTEHLLVATKDVCVDLIQDLGMSWTDIDEILLVGGSTRMPSVARFLKDLTGREVIAHSDTDLAVAKGAAITAELYCSNATGLRAMQIADVTAHSLGILSVSQDGKKFVNEIMIKRNSKVPCTVRRQFTIKKGNVTDKIEVFTLQGSPDSTTGARGSSSTSSTTTTRTGSSTSPPSRTGSHSRWRRSPCPRTSGGWAEARGTGPATRPSSRTSRSASTCPGAWMASPSRPPSSPSVTSSTPCRTGTPTSPSSVSATRSRSSRSSATTRARSSVPSTTSRSRWSEGERTPARSTSPAACSPGPESASSSC